MRLISFASFRDVVRDLAQARICVSIWVNIWRMDCLHQDRSWQGTPVQRPHNPCRQHNRPCFVLIVFNCAETDRDFTGSFVCLSRGRADEFKAMIALTTQGVRPGSYRGQARHSLCKPRKTPAIGIIATALSRSVEC